VKIISPQKSEGGQPSPKPTKSEAQPATVAITVPLSSPVIPHVSEMPKATEVPKLAESEHLAIKEKIGSEAENLDYTVSYEEHFPPVQGRADIVLRRGNQTIICQVTVTTPVEFEAESICKFLKTSIGHIALVSINRRKLNRIQQALEAVAPPDKFAKIGFYVPEEFILKLYDWAADDPEGGAVERGKPRKQKIALVASQLSENERKQREKEMLEALRKAMKR
jgi:hypothetical protein